MIIVHGQDTTCPHCWQPITLTLDLSVAEQSYIEDCPVCCKPLVVSYSTHNGAIAEFNVEASD